jgi:hypothetical protein
VALVPAFSHVSLAHHSNSYYAEDTKIMTGTVVEFKFRNPHSIVLWDVKGEDGKVVRWAGELSSLTTLLGDGVTKDSLKPGDEIIFAVRPAKLGTPQAAIQSMKRTDGKWVLQWSTQSEVGLTREQVAKARMAVGLPPTTPLDREQ